MPIEKVPAFALENRFYDKLRSPADIAIYSYLGRLSYANQELTDEAISSFSQRMGISHDSYKDSINYLIEIGFLDKGI